MSKKLQPESEKVPSAKVRKLQDLLDKRKKNRLAMLEGRYRDIDDLETPADREARILDTPAAWL